MRNTVYKTVLNGLHFTGLSAMTRYWMGGLGAILMLHHVRPHDKQRTSVGGWLNQHLEVTPDFLDATLEKLARQNFDFVSLDEMAKRLSRPRDDSANPMIAITLDDAYRNNFEYAAPIFRKHNVPYTIFVAPGLVDGRARLWWEDLAHIVTKSDVIAIEVGGKREVLTTENLQQKEQVFSELLQWLTNDVSEIEQRRIVEELAWMNKIDTKAHLKNEVMTWKEIRDLSADPLCTFGAHTIHHYAVARLSEEEARYEMKESARIIEAELSLPVRHFAFPYGYPNAAGARDFEIAKNIGFKTALTTRHGVLHEAHAAHMTALPRISLNGNFQAKRYTSALLSGVPTLLANKGRKLNVS